MEQWDTWLANDIFVCNKIKNENNIKETTNKLTENIRNNNLDNTQEINKSDETITTPLWSAKIIENPKKLNCTSKSDLNSFIQLIERKKPLNEILKIENLSGIKKIFLNFCLKDELKNEAILWDEKFPDLTIFGKGIKKSLEQQERDNLRKIISKRIIEDHLMPEVYAFLNTRNSGNNNSKSGHFFLPPILNSQKKELNKMINKK
ncbi:unnamed protein product [Meloidogyne enterolobii]|uniref:Uncharacterized protein n=1 Tax=Meloidogyne enterolobii TaxID=390850 RepID=A0ACB1ATG0_MELEN